MSENRTAIIAKLVKVAKKHYPSVSPPAGRTVLENLLYACLLENAQFTAADEAFARLEQYSDWNEVRVTTNQELCEAAAALGDPMPAIEHLKLVLHSLFETHYSFDLDFLIKENQGKAIAQLEKYKGVTPFVVSYLVQNSLGGHKIPTSAASLDFAEAIGLVTPKEKESGTVPGFERAVPKTKGPEFFSTMHQLAVDFKNKPRDKQILAILKEINPDAVKRLEAADASAKKSAAKPTPIETKPASASSVSPKSSSGENKTSAENMQPSSQPKSATPDKKALPPKGQPADKKSAPTSSGGEKKVGHPPKASVAKPAEKPVAKPSVKPPVKSPAKPLPKKVDSTPPPKTGKPTATAAGGKKPAIVAKQTPAKKKPR